MGRLEHLPLASFLGDTDYKLLIRLKEAEKCLELIPLVKQSGALAVFFCLFFFAVFVSADKRNVARETVG